jgi:hypothetical protein
MAEGSEHTSSGGLHRQHSLNTQRTASRQQSTPEHVRDVQQALHNLTTQSTHLAEQNLLMRERVLILEQVSCIALRNLRGAEPGQVKRCLAARHQDGKRCNACCARNGLTLESALVTRPKTHTEWRQ